LMENVVRAAQFTACLRRPGYDFSPLPSASPAPVI
jgi:hypothetical protein